MGDVPFRRMDRILGRSDDMLIVRGVNIFPRQIEELILEDAALTPHYRIDVHRENARDELAVTVEGTGANALAERMKSRYGLTVAVTVVETGTLPRSEGKAKRVFDHRKDKPA